MPAKKRKKKGDVADPTGSTELGDPASGGQSGDTQGLASEPMSESQSVRELVEEGNYFEAAVVQGVEDAVPTDAPVRTKQVREDDVPPEYTDRDLDEPQE